MKQLRSVLLLPALMSAPLWAGLPLESSITKDGITWTLDHAAPTGQFVNGDYYVVGPVTVTAITPAPQTTAPYMNGSVLNLPTADGKSGFDQRLNDGSDESWWFNATDRVYPPIALKAGDELVSSISLTPAQYHNVPEVMRSGDMSASPVASVSILTVLSAEQAADAFRPSYCDRSQSIYHANAINRALLPSMAPPNPAQTPPLSQFETWFRQPWIDMNPFLFDAPALYMPSYGQHIAFADSYVGLLLALNFTPAQKVNLTNYFVQYGIDLYGCVRAGYGWPAFGGHRSGRKMPVLVAGLLLNDAPMQHVSADYPNQFGEDMQTVYINTIPPPGQYTRAWQGATVIYGGHYGVQADGTPVSAGLYGPYEQLQPPAWQLLNGNEQLGEAYRRCCTSVSWVGEALAIRLLGAQALWNYPAFFDYVDRWMTEDDSQAVATIKSETGYDYTADWERQGQTQYWLQGEFPQYTFVDDMWKAYRGTVPTPPPPPVTTTPTSTPPPRVYPNPWRADRNANIKVTFDQLSPGSTVKIFTLSGHHVKTLSAQNAGLSTWDMTNEPGDPVASGIYIYSIRDSQGNSVRGKLGVIR